MKALKLYTEKLIVLIVIGLLMNGCVANRETKIAQFNSGMKKNKNWRDYNKNAEENNGPILDFLATTLTYKYNKGTIPNYDVFLTTDPKVVLETKWHNTKNSDLFEFKFYSPDGRLYHYENFIPKKNLQKWTIGRSLYIKNMPVAEFQGKWEVKIFVNKNFVVNKYFTIGKKIKTYTKAKTSITIGFAPYWNSDMSTWNHSIIAPTYVSMKALNDNAHIRMIPVRLFLKEVGNPYLNYKNFEEQIIEDLKDEDGIILSIAKKFEMNYVVLGKVRSAWSSNIQDTKLVTYIVDIRRKKIIDKVKTQKSFQSSSSNILSTQKVKGIHPNRILVYQKLYKDLKDKIHHLE